MVFLSPEQLSLIAFDILIFIVIILLTALIAKISRPLIEKTMRSSSPYFIAHVKNYVFVLIWGIGIILGMKQIGISTDILILLMGLAGLGFIVSAKYILQNYISRTFLNIQMQYKVGDMITITNFNGKVIEITDLNTVLLDKEGNLIAVPNVQLLKEVWIKHKSIEGYTMTIPVVISKEIDTVIFEKEFLNSINELKKYFKNEPKIITSKTNEKTIELSLTLSLKDPEKKSIVTVEINEIIEKLVSELTEKVQKEKKETEIQDIKDISK
ncbi:MAG: mechanosensitive ion channel domain-containing protein [Candidatus Methanoperedens sp.]